MKQGEGRGSDERCTFCAKGRRQVQNLIAGPPGVYICNECVELCNSILVERKPAKAAPEPAAPHVTPLAWMRPTAASNAASSGKPMA